MGGMTVKKVLQSKIHRFLDIFVTCSSSLFHFLLNCFIKRGGRKCSFKRRMLPQQKLISTNCSKITQKLLPCFFLCPPGGKLLFFSIASAFLGFKHCLCTLGPRASLLVWLFLISLKLLSLKEKVMVAKYVCLSQSKHI